jgi:S1-C subfamily serine protease
MGVPSDWVDKIVSASDYVKGYEIFRVAKVAVEDKSGLCESDVILALNGKVPVRFSDFHAVYQDKSFKATLIRGGREETLEIYTTLVSYNGTSRFVDFYGAIVQEPHLEVRRYVRKLYSNVYVSRVTKGSPAHHFNLKEATFITMADGFDTLGVDDFLEIVKRIPMGKCMSYPNSFSYN